MSVYTGSHRCTKAEYWLRICTRQWWPVLHMWLAVSSHYFKIQSNILVQVPKNLLRSNLQCQPNKWQRNRRDLRTSEDCSGNKHAWAKSPAWWTELDPGIHIVEGKNSHLQVLLWHPHTYPCTHTCTCILHTHRHSHTHYNK